MSDYNLGVYTTWSTRSIAIGIGWNNLGREKYVHISLVFLEIAIGRTSK